jgi:hypothetical protein
MRRLLLRAIAMTVVTAAAVVGVELITRTIDGYRLTTFRLEPSRKQASPPPSAAGPVSQKWRADLDGLSYVGQLPLAGSVDRDWFAAHFPEPHPSPPDADLQARTDRYPKVNDMRPNYEWNARFVANGLCGEAHEGANLFDQFDDIFVFDPVDGGPFPTYRFLQNAAYPSGLRTNGFGWRGPQPALRKPPQTIRIAFVGASTTVDYHSYPYSYPELVGLWLNQWAALRHPGISFDAINAGREGVNSQSIQAIVRQEVVPLEPDLVVYYEGSNQFWPADFINITLPPRSTTSGPSPGVLTSHMAIARRVDSVVRPAIAPGKEPRKPRIPVNWPPDLDEHDPNLAHPLLPIQLPRILADLEVARGAVEASGGRLIMTSFFWLVYPGMVLDPVRDAMLYDYLNITFWPFSYAHMQRFIDFENAAFRNYARMHNLDFIDVAGVYPRDPRLFEDAIHMTRAGVRLHAWITFNALVPIIERGLAAHEWPRPDREQLTRHPAFIGGRHLASMRDLRAACDASGQ